MRKVIFGSKFFVLLMVEIVLGLILSVGMAMLFLKIYRELFLINMSQFDVLVSEYIYQVRDPLLTGMMKFVTDFGADYLLVNFLALVSFFLWKKRKREALSFTIILATGLLLNLLLKELIQRPRPMMSPLVAMSSYSFPSGHTMNSTIFYLTMAFYYYHLTRRKRGSLFIMIGALGVILLIGFSRVYLGVHYPSDVLAGYVVGTWWLVTILLINKSYSFVKHYREEKKKLSF